jgi:hypothetical protein
MDFSSRLAKGVSITGVTSVTVDKITNPQLVIGAPSYGAGLVQFNVSGGLGDTKYIVTVYVTTSVDAALQGEGILQVTGASNFALSPPAGGIGAAGN